MVQVSETSRSDRNAEQVRPTTHSLDANLVFYNLHYRVSIFYLRHTSSKVRSFLELFWMLLAVSGFAALICLHLAFVYRGNLTPASLRDITHRPLRSIPSTCLPSVPGFRQDANVTHLVLLEDAKEKSFAWEIDSPMGASELNKTCSASDTNACETLRLQNGQVHFSFSKTKGYALLTPNLSDPYATTHAIPTQIVAISKTDVRCFGETFLQETVFRLLGPDLVMMNWLLATSNGTGFIYNPRTDETVDLRQYAILNARNSGRLWDVNEWSNWFRPWTSKFRTTVKTCLIYFISTNLVSFLLRVAQERLLELSVQIRSHQQENRSIIPLFVTHVADCFVFVPITVGVLFYLREFYQQDWVIALTVLATVFVGELFSFVSVRTAQGIFFFPRAFFLLFCLVHFYLFSFPFGFSYVACFSIVCFMFQCFTFFWNRYEVPAVALGRVSVDHRTRVDYSSNAGESSVAASRDTLQRHQLVTNQPAASSGLPARRTLSPPRRATEPTIRLQPQYQQTPIRYTYSQGAFSQERMSRASSEAIFQRSADADDESESCLYFLGGEVVIRHGDGPSSDSAGESNQMNRYDSSSTLQSAVATAHLGTITDEAATSGLQAIHDAAAAGIGGAHDLTPRLCNLARGAGTIENSSSGAPIFPLLDSLPRGRQRRHDNE